MALPFCELPTWPLCPSASSVYENTALFASPRSPAHNPGRISCCGVALWPWESLSLCILGWPEEWFLALRVVMKVSWENVRSPQCTVLVVGLSVFFSSSGLHVIPTSIPWLALYLKPNYGEQEGYVAMEHRRKSFSTVGLCGTYCLPFLFFLCHLHCPIQATFPHTAACGRNGFQYIFSFSRSAGTESQRCSLWV